MKTFSGTDIDAIMSDIEGLDLPIEYNFGVLRIVLDAVEIHGCVPEERIEIEGTPTIEIPTPEFLKSIAKRNMTDVQQDLEDRLVAKMEVKIFAEGADVGGILPNREAEPESPAPQPRTAIAPQAAFSPAPMPEVVEERLEDHSSHGVRWTKEEEDMLIKGRLQGKPYEALAERTGHKERACASKMFWLTKNRAARIERIKAEMGLPATKPTTLRAGPWTLDEEKRLLDMRAEGVPFKVIAQKMSRPVGGLTQKFYNLRDVRKKPAARPASKVVGPVSTAPAIASKAEGGKGILPRPCPDESWPIEDDFDLVSEHHRGLPMLDVSIILERTKPDCVARYNALIEAMPAGPFTERQTKLKQTLTAHSQLARKAA